MKKMNRNVTKTRLCENLLRSDAVRERLYWASAHSEEEILNQYGTPADGLTEALADRARDTYGENVLTYGKREPLPRRLLSAFINPFTAVLLALAVISAFTDVAFAAPGDRNYATVLMITAMVLISGTLRFVQETRSGNVAEKLTGMLHTTACVERSRRQAEIPMEEIAVGDLVYLSAGDMIPADVRILSAKDLFVSQSALTGESEPVEKRGTPAARRDALTEAGKALAAEARRDRTRRHEEMFSCLSPEEKAALLRLLEKLNGDWRIRYPGAGKCRGNHPGTRCTGGEQEG